MCAEPPVLWVLVVCKVFAETRESLVKWASKDCLVFPDPSDPWVSKDPSVQLVLLAQSDFVESKEKWVLQVCEAHLELLAQLVPLVFVERLEDKVLRESKDLLESRVTLALRVSRVTLARLDLSDLPVLLESLARTERTAKLGLVVLVETAAHRACVVLLGLLVPKDSRERKVLKAAPDPVVSKESKDPRVTPVTVDPRDPVEVERLDLRDLKASKVPREVLELLDLVLVALLDPWEPEANVERWVNKDKREILVHLDLRVPLGAMDSRETVVLLDPWAVLVFVDPRETRVSMDSRVRLVCPDPRARRETKESVVPRARRVPLDLLVLLVLLVSGVLLDQLADPVSKERWEAQASKDPGAPRETRGTVASADLKVSVARRVFQVLVVLVVTRATKASVELLASLAPVVFLVCKESLEMLVPWDLVAPVGSLVNKVFPVPVVSVDPVERQVLLAPRVPAELSASKERLVSLARRALPVQTVHVVLKV